jgi:hypothetical protein
MSAVPSPLASHNFAVDAIKPGGARIDVGAAGASHGFSAVSTSSGFSGSLNTSVLDIASQHGNAFGVHEDKNQGTHNANNGNGALTLNTVAEPGSGTLSLFGFVVLGMMVYRRKAPKNAV